MKLRRVSGDSMAPTLKAEQVIVVAKARRRPRFGDVVVLRHGGLEKVKRVSRIEGDELFVEGDNRTASTDSRHFGWIHNDMIIGKVIWPRIKRYSYQK